MMLPGNPGPKGAHWNGEGVNFCLYLASAEAVTLCLFNDQGIEIARHDLPDENDGNWYGYLPGCKPGQRYGYRVHGRYAPEEGLRFNRNKLLIDPYARTLDGRFSWSPAVYDYDRHDPAGQRRMSVLDSAAHVPKCVVSAPQAPVASSRPAIPWPDMVIYEANVRGFSMSHPAIAEKQRGKFRGLCNREILAYLKALGITSVELLPVHYFIDEAALVKRGLRNFWGYNSINFFAPEHRYSESNGVAEFREMVEGIHAAGIEVILDVVYNHTAESDEAGPTLSYRGIDNLCYYRTHATEPGRYLDSSGCGNTLNTDHPRVQDLVIASLQYWYRDMDVDGFRFDLAPALGRTVSGFDRDHPLLQKIATDKTLCGAKLIAEPWDTADGGYQLGQFTAPWSEQNDRFRDSVRRFWRGDRGEAGELARRLHGSADLFEASGRKPVASVNFVTSHDGFTLSDLVSFEDRHNEANGEDNRDGHAKNYSVNYGVEGETSDAFVNMQRRRQRLNMLASLLFSQGVPLILAGDEFGNSQQGNNNAYAQDNEIGWLDWSGLAADPDFHQKVSELISLRRSLPLLRRAQYCHDGADLNLRRAGINWLNPDGLSMELNDWQQLQAFMLLLSSEEDGALAIIFNAGETPVGFALPDPPENSTWRPVFSSGEVKSVEPRTGKWRQAEQSIACLQAVMG